MKRRYFSALAAPPAVAPLFSSSEIGTVNAVTLAVTFSENISASNYATGVTIKVNTVSQTIVSATRQANHAVVYYVIDDIFIVNTDTVTWEYTGGNIVSESGSVSLATVTAQTVTNNEEIMKATVTLTNAQIKALPTTPITIVAAPGAGKVVFMFHAFLHMNWTADYTGIDAGAVISFSNNETQGYLSQTVSSSVSSLLAGGGPDGTNAYVPFAGFVPPSAGNVNLNGRAGAYDSDIENVELTIRASNGLDFTGGNAANSIDVTVFYAIVDL